MNTKTYLSQLWNIDKRIKDKLAEADKWMEIAYGRSIGKSKEIKHDTIQTSHEPDKIADAVVKSIDYYHEAVELSKDMVEKKHTIEKQISSIVDDNHYNILHAYYVEDKTLGDIADETHYSRKSIKRKYEAAIIHFEKLYGACYL